MTKIECQAKECVYNEHCHCSAKEIEVCNCGCHEAHHREQTECSTFRKRED